MTTPITQLGTNRSVGSSADGRWMAGGRKAGAASRLRGVGRRRRVPHLLLGVLLVLVCTAAFVMVWLSAGDRRPVLALVRAVPVGQVLAMGDLREVRVAVDASVRVVAASQVAVVVGRPMSVSLPAGALLTPDAVGVAAVPGAGQALAAVALKPGQVPAEVSAGARVSIVSVPGLPVGGAAAGRSVLVEPSVVWPGVVTSVASAVGEQVTVVSVLLSEAAARQVAAVPAGQLSIVMLSAGGR